MNETTPYTAPTHLDPYRTLQVHPAAPRDLIDETYWLLASDIRRRRATAASRAVLADLNEAYALLSDDRQRGAYDEQHAPARRRNRQRPPRRRRLFVVSRAGAVERMTHYERLCIDPGAAPYVVDLAYRVMRQTERYRRAGPDRRALDEAYAALLDVESRVAYDRSLGLVSGAIAATGPQVAREQALPDAMARATVEDERDNLISDVVDEVPAEADATPATPVEAPQAQITDAQPAIAVDEPAAAAEAPGPAVRRPGATSALAGLVRRLRPQPKTESGQVEAVAAIEPLTAPGASTAVHAPHVPVYDDQLVAQRLAALRDKSVAPSPARPAVERDREKASPATVEFLDGPRAGSAAGIVERWVLREGDELSPELCRIAVHLDRFVLHATAGGVVVNGELLTLPLVFLDDGDEVAVGSHRFRFRLGDGAVSVEEGPRDSVAPEKHDALELPAPTRGNNEYEGRMP